ncbi:hypothetical protein [uncultured Flavobacterium sp.]|uniref:hypothetical protein n=1 Tax=uncultured Flavobacterium sp. TaxID=165435 RepID=UPI0025F9ABA1|nr:hypothetical protein [uncultured Flavobacterium sp.]
MRKVSQIAPMVALSELFHGWPKPGKASAIQRELRLLKMPDDSLQIKNPLLVETGFLYLKFLKI